MKISKPLLIGVIAVVAVLIIVFCVQKAEPKLENFVSVNTYASGQFTDVPSSAWYAENVESAYKLGLMKGSSDTTFNPQGNITIGETIALSCRLYSIYYGDGEKFAETDPWYKAYVTYAADKGIIKNKYDDYNASATRADFARILAAALPSKALEKINDIKSGAIPDIAYGENYENAVYKLYRAGILTGSDEIGTFAPTSYISRGEVATIAARMADKKLRKNVSLSLYAQCSPAVYRINFYNKNGEYVSSYSTFFINDQGDAIVNYLAIKDMASADICFEDSDETYPVESILGYNADKNIAVIHVNDGSDFKSLKIANPSEVARGQKVYYLDCRLDLGDKNTIAKTTVINPKEMYADGFYLKLNSKYKASEDYGGVLLNEKGEAIGALSSYSVDDGYQLAVPLCDLKSYYFDKPIKLD